MEGAPAASTTTAAAGAPFVSLNPPPPAQDGASTDQVLHRLKELNEANNEKDSLIQKLQQQLKTRDDKVKELSADKRKEMEEFMKGVVDNWLNSLTEVSETHKTNFREGIKNMAESADVRNPAWEIVCNASKDYLSNVKRIEDLLQDNAMKDKKIEELSGFRNEAARFVGDDRGPKRLRTSEEAPRHLDSGAPPQQAGMQPSSFVTDGPSSNAWDQFSAMIRNDCGSSYY